MYKKEVRINGKRYSYYYYNLREGDRVRNICLGSDRNFVREITLKNTNKMVKYLNNKIIIPIKW